MNKFKFNLLEEMRCCENNKTNWDIHVEGKSQTSQSYKRKIKIK